jgi:hypothetical protein
MRRRMILSTSTESFNTVNITSAYICSRQKGQVSP